MNMYLYVFKLLMQSVEIWHHTIITWPFFEDIAVLKLLFEGIQSAEDCSCSAFQEKMAESLVGTWILQPQFDQIAQPLPLHWISAQRVKLRAGFEYKFGPLQKSKKLLWMLFTYSQLSMMFDDDDDDDDD